VDTGRVHIKEGCSHVGGPHISPIARQGGEVSAICIARSDTINFHAGFDSVCYFNLLVNIQYAQSNSSAFTSVRPIMSGSSG
jgi:hypothetical protein